MTSVNISTYGPLSAGTFMSAASSATYPAANRAIAIPFRTPDPFIVKQLYACNGATVSGNIDVGVYDLAGTRIISAGSTAQAGTSVLQVFDVTDTLIGAGAYYIVVAMDNTTGTLFRQNHNTHQSKFFGMTTVESSFSLPATLTFGTAASGYSPFMGVAGVTVV